MVISKKEAATKAFVKLLKSEKRIKVKLKKLKLFVPSIASATGLVAKFYNVQYRILIESHSRHTMQQRYVAFYICKRILNHSFRRIERFFGIAQGTLFRALKRFKELLIIHPELDIDIRAIRLIMSRKYAV